MTVEMFVKGMAVHRLYSKLQSSARCVLTSSNNIQIRSLVSHNCSNSLSCDIICRSPLYSWIQ